MSEERSSELEARIRARIEEAGPMPVAEYMALCLTHPDHGYYTTSQPIGGRGSSERSGGDFITAPEISQMFGEMIGVWAMEVWQALGAPERFSLVELGPGRGTLMRDILRISGALPAFQAAMDVVFVEISPTLAEQQSITMAEAGTTARWVSDIEAIPDHCPAIIIGNEFLDALPAHQWVWLEGAWHLRAVGVTDGNLTFTTAPGTLDTSNLPEDITIPLKEGDILELSPACEALVATIAEKLMAQNGAALFLDYGRTKPALTNTFQAVRNHAYANPLESPGSADLTFHVDFSALSATARAAGCAVPEPVNQGAFLLDLGLLERAGNLGHGRSDAVQAQLRAAVERLAGESGMGTLFKAFAFGAPASLGNRWPGFAL